MRKTLLFILPLLAIFLSSCKEDQWMDWKQQNEAWLEQNIIDHEGDSLFFVTDSGLQYKILYKGNTSDTRPDDASVVYCDYEGWLINGQRFEVASYTALTLSTLVEGMQEGLKKIYNHGDIILYIPADLGYAEKEQGTEGSSAASYIPPYSTLIFKVHVCAIAK